jgi:hypothetical protein
MARAAQAAGAKALVVVNDKEGTWRKHFLLIVIDFSSVILIPVQRVV